MTVFDPRYEDVDFRKEPEYTFGAIETSCLDGWVAPCYEATFGVLSESELREAAEDQAANGGIDDYVQRIFDQSREGACVGNAAAQGMEASLAKLRGVDDYYPLSAMSLYKQIGRSAQSGAVVSDSLEALQTTGLLPLDTPENRARFGDHVMPNIGFDTPFPSGWKDTASLTKILEANVLRSVSGILTSLARQQPVIVGREGHSICYVRLVFDNVWKVIYVNSWRENWGFALGKFSGGFGIDTMRQIEKSASWAYSIRSICAA